MWFLLMLVILLANGIGAFGLKMIVAWHLPADTKLPYLTIWYATGLVAIGVPMLSKGFRLQWKEMMLGVVMALLSTGGQLFLGTTLASGIPGSIAFPLAGGGSLILVVLFGWLGFGERLNLVSKLGITFGFLAVILLGMS